MKYIKNILILLFIVSSVSINAMAQSDTTNKVDENGKKIGYWIITGDISKEPGYDATAKVMEGTYVRNRKNGLWIKYHKNGNIMSKEQSVTR